MTVNMFSLKLEVAFKGFPMVHARPAAPVVRKAVKEVSKICEACCVVVHRADRSGETSEPQLGVNDFRPSAHELHIRSQRQTLTGYADVHPRHGAIIVERGLGVALICR